MWSFPWRRRKETAEKEDAAQNAPMKRLLSYQVANLQGIGTRARQEDSFAFANVLDVTEIRQKGLLAAVADGMGGMKDGQRASETAVFSLKAGFAAMDREADLSVQLCDSVYKAGEQINQLLEGDGGSTLVACVIYQEQLYYASVGDSFLYLKRDGQLLRLNREHTYRSQLYLEAIRSGSMVPGPANTDPERAALTQFLGMDQMSEIDCFRRPLPLKDGDVLLICSDGVGGVLTEEKLLGCLERKTPAEACAGMEEEIRRQNRQYQDNYTALAIYCSY